MLSDLKSVSRLGGPPPTGKAQMLPPVPRLSM
jgi:hypothetical protein